MCRFSKEVVSFIKPTGNKTFCIYDPFEIKLCNSFLANAPFFFSLKRSKKCWFSGVFLGGIIWEH